jgi:hypothetical protein
MDNQSRFGEPLDLEDLLDFAEIDEADIDSAIEWFDEHASEDWQGALGTPPCSPQYVV